MENKEKFQLEVSLNASPQLLYQYISTPAGLSSWYADDVRTTSDTYTFEWDGVEEKAQLLRKKLDEAIRFHWVEDEDLSTYFEIRIRVNELTQEVSLVITDLDLKTKIGAA